MIDLEPAPVPELNEEWIVSHRSALLEAIGEPHHTTAKWAVVGTASVAAAVSVSALVLAGGGHQVADHAGARSHDVFLGWSASPTTPAAGQLTAADAACQSSLTKLGPTNMGGGSAPLVPELSDVRGPFTVTVFGNGTQSEALCLSTPGATSAAWIAVTGTSPGPGAIGVDRVSYLTRTSQPYTMVVGRTGTGVTGVTLSLADGDSVTTTSGNGYFVAWWPGGEGLTSATLATASGTSTTQPLNVPGPGASPSTKPAPPPGAHVSHDPSGNSTVCLVHDCG